MNPYYAHGGVTLYHGDSREWVASLDDRSVDCVITDPPFSDKTHEATRTNNTANGRRGNRVLSGSFGFDHIDLDEARSVLSSLGRISKGWVISNLDYNRSFGLPDRYRDAKPARPSVFHLLDRVPEVMRLSQDPRAKLQYFQTMCPFV